MSTKNTDHETKALVTVFEDLETAVGAVKALHDAGFGTDKIELVTSNLHEASPDVSTPKDHETTASSLVESAEKWGAVGAGTGAAAGLVAAVVTGFPGIILGMIVMGGVTGAMMGGMAGVDHAVEDDSVDLPTLKEYEQRLHDGQKIVIVHGPHDDMLKAKEVIAHLPRVHEHLHRLHGHESHEHPSSE